jgi:hypothetical protein
MASIPVTLTRPMLCTMASESGGSAPGEEDLAAFAEIGENAGVVLPPRGGGDAW